MVLLRCSLFHFVSIVLFAQFQCADPRFDLRSLDTAQLCEFWTLPDMVMERPVLTAHRRASLVNQVRIAWAAIYARG